MYAIATKWFMTPFRGSTGDEVQQSRPTSALPSRRACYVREGGSGVHTDQNLRYGPWNCSLEKGNSLPHRGLRARGRLVGEPRCPSSAIPRNLEQADFGRSTPPLATLVYTETKMSTHKHSEAGNELRSLSMIRYDQSMNATTQISKDSHFWHLTPLPAHRQVHTSHTPTSGFGQVVGV